MAPGNPIAYRQRTVIALALGVLAGMRTFHIAADPGDPTDFGQVWFASRALLHGANPYALVGPGRAFPTEFTLVYPLTAAVAALPLAGLTLQWACALFSAFSAAAFAWALMANGFGPLLGFVGASMAFATEEAQWSPLFAAAVVLPPLGMFIAAKPTIGTAIFVARPSVWALVGGAALCAVAFAMQPHWLGAWRSALTTAGPGAPAPYLEPVRLPYGVIALATLLRWRRPEARLVAALACVPQTGLLYDAVPLFLVPRDWREAGLMTVASYGVVWWIAHQTFHGDYAAYLSASGRALTLVLYPLSTFFVLRRPNEGTMPEWLEKRLILLPKWARGHALNAS